MKPGVIYCMLLSWLCLCSYGQTSRIAHKSHSGKAHSFSVYTTENFGIPSPKLDSVKKISPQKVVIYRSEFGSKNEPSLCDTLTKHARFLNPEIPLDSLKKIYPYVKFIGFDKKPALLKKKPA